MNRKEAEVQLKKIFGFNHFHDEQWTTIKHVLHGDRVLLIERTGFGKSLCYQFPAAVLSGITIIFSPLIALMRDQVQKLNSLGIVARCLNSEQNSLENSKILKDAKDGKIKILYIAPERMDNAVWMKTVKQLNLSMVVVDEAHCISVWGHDFRPAFRRIIELVKTLPAGIPVLATTATATKTVEEDIIQQMGGNAKSIRGKLMRDNLQLQVIQVGCQDDKLIWLAQHLEKLEGSGIIYTGTRKDVTRYTNWLKQNDIPCAGYHAGLSPAERVKIEKGLMNNDWKCVISTNALGMGIDKPDIRFIIHTQIPQSPIHYYQEIGRAGRDGDTGRVILLYHPTDVKLPQMFINFSKPAVNSYMKVIQLLQEKRYTEQELCKKTNIFEAAMRSIKADLIEQGLIVEKQIGQKKYLYTIAGAPPMDFRMIDKLREIRMAELDEMVAYAETRESRMKFLCRYLGDEEDNLFKNCDNSGIKPLTLKPDTRLETILRKFYGDVQEEEMVETANAKNTLGIKMKGIERIKRKVVDSNLENPFG
ncbi:MAG: RecQ family ATP-dependent DNA helicase [Bacteroidetes bacterium]|nr:RecQ family ATP-dependent DNA helicase [Bacteroidota bacterium]